MKTPDEIKKGLWCCSQDDECGICPYANGECHNNKVKADAIAYIQQLEADNSRLADTIRSLTDLLNAAHEETAKAMRERDAAVRWLSGNCNVCRWAGTEKCDSCDEHEDSWFDDSNSNWEWEGVCPENTEER